MHNTPEYCSMIWRPHFRVSFDAIEVVVIDHGCGLHDPRIGRATSASAVLICLVGLRRSLARSYQRIAALLRCIRPDCFSDACMTTEELKPYFTGFGFALLELAEALLCDRVLALVLMKGNEINVFGGNEP